MVRTFAEHHFVSKGLAVQLDVHAPHGADSESERANWHAHLLITTRRIEGDEFSAKKARDLDPEVRSAGGRARVADGAAWGALWGEHQDQYFREHGLDVRVDAAATHAQEHIGPVRMRRTGAEIVERAETIREANQEAARDPAQVLATLTRNNATFTERDLDRHLTKQLGQKGTDAAGEIEAVRAAVLKSAELVPLHDRESGAAAGRFTTRQVRKEERSALSDAEKLAEARSGAVSGRSAQAAEAARSMRPDQQEAFAYATGAGKLKVIVGRAGTGKSYTLGAIADAHERDGMRVVGLAPTNAVAQDMAGEGFREASTAHSALFKLKNGRTSWDRNTVVVVDEAAMLDTRITGELLSAARQAGAKLVLAGDDRQLASIERGGLFTEMRERHGAAEITEVTRQRVDWQRQAARDLAEGRFADAVGAFDRAGAITWTDKQEQARSALVAAWTRDGAERPGQSRFVFAYTNKDVDALNAELRQVRRERGELTGADVRLETKHGAASFAVGDRVQFTDTDKKLRIYNGNVGTITGLDARTGQLTARMDAAGSAGREVTFSPGEFEGFRHGYAGTIYKGQGKTLDRTYLYHTEHWRSAASYVALTRQRESAQVFVARETARDAGQLARQMGRGEVRAASVAWAAADGLPRARQERERPERQPEQAEAPRQEARAKPAQADPGKGYWQSLTRKPEAAQDEDSLRAKVRGKLAARQGVNAKEDRPEPQMPAGLTDAQRQLRREVQALDRPALAEAARADQVGRSFETRPMTVKEAARLVSPEYATAADRADELRKTAAEVGKAIDYNERVQRSGREQGDRRWKDMGIVRQTMHKTGARLDPAITASESTEGKAVEELKKLDVQRAQLARFVPIAERAEAAAFRQAEPAATAELAKRQERASVAREVLGEQRRQEMAREQTLKRSRGLGLGR